MAPPERVPASNGPKLAPPTSDTNDTRTMGIADRLSTCAVAMFSSAPLGSAGTCNHLRMAPTRRPAATVTGNHQRSPWRKPLSTSSGHSAFVARPTASVNNRPAPPAMSPIGTAYSTGIQNRRSRAK